tara:strand:- start:127 stop:381 length:255 start_codon:yes stop_codon:yes gene_type:complete
MISHVGDETEGGGDDACLDGVSVGFGGTFWRSNDGVSSNNFVLCICNTCGFEEGGGICWSFALEFDSSDNKSGILLKIFFILTV